MSHFSAFGNRLTGLGTIWPVLGPQFFQANRNDGICPEKTRANSSAANYFQGFLPVQHAVSLPPAKLSASYFHGFLSVQHAVSLPPSKALRKLFARFSLRPACCLAPSRRSFPQAVSLPPSSASYFHGFLSVQHAISLPPSETLRKLFSHFPPCSISSPSNMLSRSLPTNFPQAISTVFSPSSMLSRSLPA